MYQLYTQVMLLNPEKNYDFRKEVKPL